MQTKSKIIRDKLEIMQMDPEWCLSSLIGDNPLVWMLEVDGFVIDARSAPIEFQQEAYRLGLIPYIPGESSTEKSEPQSDNGARIIEFPSKLSKKPDSQHVQKARDEGPGLFE
jgi:hypothetical protein